MVLNNRPPIKSFISKIKSPDLVSIRPHIRVHWASVMAHKSEVWAIKQVLALRPFWFNPYKNPYNNQFGESWKKSKTRDRDRVRFPEKSGAQRCIICMSLCFGLFFQKVRSVTVPKIHRWLNQGLINVGDRCGRWLLETVDRESCQSPKFVINIEHVTCNNRK